jgi:hypothetical protein
MYSWLYRILNLAICLAKQLEYLADAQSAGIVLGTRVPSSLPAVSIIFWRTPPPARSR